jgi:glycosyltransferase involved in cell wall biosynthesis
VELFNNAWSKNLQRPADMRFEGKAVIGFAGSIEYRTDFELLKKIAVHHHNKILFLVGPVQGDEHKQWGLHELPNVVFAGPRKLSALPAYMKYFDCAIIPYKRNTLTKSIYPLKINEYLAAGKPVIATNFSEDIYSFRDDVYIANNHEEFIHAIDQAIIEDNDQKKQQRVNIAASNSWAKRAEQFWRII